MNQRPKKGHRQALLVLFLLAVALRILPSWFHQFERARLMTVDSLHYVQLAESLADDHRFVLNDEPEIFRTPGYPIFLALCDSLPGRTEVWIVMLQALADAVGVVLIAALVTHWLTSAGSEQATRAGLFAGLIAALDPTRILYSQLVMSDTLNALMVVVAFFLLAVSPRVWLGGITLSFATALRPVALLLWLPGALLISSRRKAVILFLSTSMLFAVGWSIRNGFSRDVWSVSTAFDINLSLVAAQKVQNRASEAPSDLQRQVSELAEQDGLPRHLASRQVALRIFRSYPIETAKELFFSSLEMLLAGERRYLEQVFGRSSQPAIGEGHRSLGAVWDRARALSWSSQLLVVGQLVWMAIVWILAAIGIWSWPRSKRVELTAICLAIGLVLGPSLVVATGRMRLPVSGLIAALAGCGASHLWSRRNFRQRKPVLNER